MRCTQRTILSNLSLFLSICLNHGLVTAQELTRDEMRGLLQERDAAIIELQNTVRDLLTRIEAVERSVSPTRFSQPPSSQLNSGDSTRTETQQGFGTLEVDEQAAQRALERTLTQGGALLLPAWRMEFGPSLSSALNQIAFPTVVADGETSRLVMGDFERTTFTANMDVRVGLPFDSQFELSLPYQWADEEINIRLQGMAFGQTSQANGRGIGSLKLGLAKTFARERGWRPDVVGRVTWDTGSGNFTDNGVFIGGFESVGGSLTFIKRSDPLVFFGSASYRSFFKEAGLEPGDQFAYSLGTALAVSPTSSLFASISNQFYSETEFGKEQIDGSDITSVVLNIGASTIISRGFLLNLSTGIGISEDAPDYSIGISATLQTDVLLNLFYRD